MKTETFFTALFISMNVAAAIFLVSVLAFGIEINIFEVPPMANVTLPLYEFASEKTHHMFTINDTVIDIAYNK